MLPTTTLLLSLIGTALGFNACQLIAEKVSSATDVYYPGSSSYIANNEHYATSSSQVSKCSVEPGSAEDVGTVLGILGKTKTPFGVKGGGHATNPDFSSTTGVQISMARFNEITYDPMTKTAVVGAGGRVTGIGVAGFTLGGGYSWLSNQYGLALDNVVRYELVVPNGTVVTVTDTSHTDLFFSLKGGGNNYGIVTRFTLKTHPQGAVWGGIAAYNASHISAFTAASVKFCSEVTDPRAGIIIVYGYTSGEVILSTQMFYDGAIPPKGIFDDFLAIPALTQDTVMTRSKFSDLINATVPTINASTGLRTVYNHMPMLNYSESSIDEIIDEVNFWGPMLSAHGPNIIAYVIEPFLPSLLSHAPTDSSAYPSSRDHVAFPTNLNLQWLSETEDEVFHGAARQTAERLSIQGESIYPNYAIYGTPVVDMFGEEGVKKMEAMRKRVDPHGVMMLTGGFRV
ncbi:FAD dependent oxidoreductase [Armillaria luteobubalina]|uniref:FAD dependent oxidoreductase n=1 Tax=Armillaria luteobubalina TaxID=153913 RepID=A0AA39QBA8_9AGAR|nr:FAD dependent oxidoreductase [Armillaria luteobubalina]